MFLKIAMNTVATGLGWITERMGTPLKEISGKDAEVKLRSGKKLVGCSIIEPVLLEGTYDHPIWIEHCVIYGIKAQDCVFSQKFQLQKTEVKGKADFNSACFKENTDWVNVTFEGRAVFEGAVFEDRAEFTDAHFLDEAVFNEVQFEGDLDMEEVGFEQAEFCGAKFEAKANFSHAVFDELADFTRSQFDHEANFVDARFSRGADFDGVTFKGKGSFPENHPLSLGPIGMHGHAEANKIMTEADCVLAIGTRFSDRSVGTFEEFERNLKIIHMDVDPAEIGKNQTAQVAVVGDVKSSLRVMLKLLVKKTLKKSDGNKWLEHVNEVRDYWRENLKLHPGEMSAAKILRKLRELLPKESIVTTEVGQHQMWASLFFDAIHPGTFFSSTGLGTMGWGFPAAIGAKVARPDVPVVDIAGDGSFNMTENSLATSVLEDIPVIVFLINNFSLGMVAQWQRTFYDRRMIGIDLKKCPDYVKLAESYGAQGIRAQSLDELGKAVKAGLNSDVATVIDIPIDPEEDVLPFVAPGTSLKDMILPS